MYMINLPYEIGIYIREQIDRYRYENNIPVPEELLKIRNKNDTFLKSELELIKELKINKKMMKHLDLFPNVEKIILDGNDELNEEDIKIIISKYPNIKELTLYGQDKIKVLDIRNLKEIQSLTVISNYGLKKIIGLDHLQNLTNFSFYDNQSYLNIEEAVKCALSAKTSELDVLYLGEYFALAPQKENYVLQNIKWCEAIGNGIYSQNIKYTTDELKEAYKKASLIVETYIKEDFPDIIKYAIINMWVCENIRYDYESLNNKHSNPKSKIIGGANGTVDALTLGYCVCQGYSKAMQLLLKLSGIKAYDVACDTNNAKESFNYDGKKNRLANHSVIRVELNGKTYYSDVTWDASLINAGLEPRYCLMSKEDFSVDHKLKYEEEISASKTIDKNEYLKLLDKVKNYIKSIPLKTKENIKNTLCSVNKELIRLRKLYKTVCTKIEDKYKNKQINDIQDDLKMRDQISKKIDELMKYQESLYASLGYYINGNDQNYIETLENLLGIQITNRAQMVDNEKYNGIPYYGYKTKEELQNEYQNILTRLNKLIKDKIIEVEPIVEAKLKSALKNKYEEMIKEVEKDSMKKQTKKVVPEVHNEEQKIKEKETGFSEKEHLRRKYNYYDMDEVEKEMFRRWEEEIEENQKKIDRKKADLEAIQIERPRRMI